MELKGEQIQLEQLGPCATPEFKTLPDGTLGMENGDWIALYERCRIADLKKHARIHLWEIWEKNERVAQKEAKP